MENENTKKLVVLSEIDELKVIANNHYLMGKFNDAIKVTERIIEIAETAKLYSIVREYANFIAEIYKKIKEEDKFSLIRDDFENLKRNYENLLQKNAIVDAHQLVDKFRKDKEKFIKLNDIDVVTAFIKTDEERWNEFNLKEASLKKKLEALEIQFNSYLNTFCESLIGLESDEAWEMREMISELKEVHIKYKKVQEK